MNLTRALADLADHQHGVVTRRQLLDGGVTPAQLRTRLGREWRLLLRGVVLLSNGLATDPQRLMAAQLFAGPESWLAGPTAAALHRVPGCEVTNPVHVLVPAPRRARTHAWVVVRNTTLVDEHIHRRGPVRFSCPARATIDAAAEAPTRDQATALVVAAAQSRIARLGDLTHWALARGPVGSRKLVDALAVAGTGAWSIPEADLLRLVATSTLLPRAMANPDLTDGAGRRLTTPDAWFDDVAMAVMVHSRRRHSGELEWEATVEHDTDLQTARIVVVGVTPPVAERPRRTVQRIEDAYLAARASGVRADVVARPRDPWLNGRVVGPRRAVVAVGS